MDEEQEKNIDNEEKSNKILSSIDEKFSKFDTVFKSMISSINSQSQILQSILDIQESSLKTQLETVEAIGRAELLNKVTGDDKNKAKNGGSEKKEKNGFASLFEESKGLFSLGGLLNVGALLFLAPLVADFIKDFVTRSFENMGFDNSLTNGFAEAIGEAALFGMIGKIFGKRIRLLLAGAGFLDSIFDFSGMAQSIAEFAGIEMGDTTAKIVGIAIGAALTAALPKILGKALPALFGKALGFLKSGGGAPPRTTTPSTGTQPRAATPSTGTGTPQPRDARGRFTAAPPAPTPTPPASSGITSTIKNAGSSLLKGVKGNAPVAAAIGLVEAGMAYTDDTLTSNQKNQAYGAAAGGAVGGAIGATIGSVVPVVGTYLGGMAGYYLGSMAGQALVGEAGYDQATVDKLKSTDPSQLSEEERTVYATQLQEQYKAAVGIERELMNSDKSNTPDYEHIQKQISDLSSILTYNGIDPASVADKSGGYTSPNEGVTFTENYAFRKGTDGFEQFGSGTSAVLHGSEAVVPEATVAGQILKSMFKDGWNSLDVTGISSIVTKGIDYISQQSSNMTNGAGIRNSMPVVAPITNNYYQGGNSTNNSSTVVLGSTGMDLDRPGYAR